MKNNLTEMVSNNTMELVFVLDRSGSMSGLEQDTIGGFNSLLDRQRNEDGETYVTTILFDDNYEILHERFNIKNIKPLTEKEYYVRGTTALLDAIGKTIINTEKAFLITDEIESRKVMFVVITDGMENSSSEFSYKNIKNMIEHKKTKDSWEFIFLGANIDAIKTASKFGINDDRATNFCNDSTGINLNYEVISETVSYFRKENVINKNWKAEIEKDYTRRGK